MFAQDRICAPIGATTADEARRRFREAVSPPGRARAVELRLDYLRGPAERDALLNWLSRQKRLPIVIATCRPRRSGGHFTGTVESELAVLAKAVRSGCRWCDVGIETASQVKPAELRTALAPARVIISAHDFKRVPGNLPKLLRSLEHHGGDALKLAATCHNLADARRLLPLARGRRDLVVIPMGEAVLPARLLALREGGALTFGSVGEPTAPGQLSLEALRNVYRLGAGQRRSPLELTRRTKVYGVIGDPIGHSLSPLLQNIAFAAHGLDAIYLPFHVRDLRDFLGAIEPFGIAGFSVTLPHKETILRHLDECDPLAAEVGAVNTVAVRSGRLYGYNTDYVGVLRAIEKRVSLPSSRVLLFGAGGSARSAAFALKQAGAEIVVCARRAGRAKSLARAVRGETIERDGLARESFDVIVNCTPVGMYPNAGCPLKASELNCRAVMDLIYRPRKTELLRRAEKLGLATISGVEMFLEQGYEQYEIWTGRRAPAAAMRRALTRALDAEERASAAKVSA
jgi:3-dehydroquinate dehydratase/shikimate dehydrogenase